MTKTKPLQHILFWAGIYLLWVFISANYSVSLSKSITIEFCYLIFITGDYYVITYYIIPQYLLKKKYLLCVLLTALLIGVSAWLRALVAVQMNLYVFKSPVVPFGTLYANSIVNITLWVLVVAIGKMLIDKIQTQRQMELLEKERIKTELEYLKAQINPHALFNSLNTIYGHIDKTNQVARKILLQFSELLRYQLYDCSAEYVSLEKEIEYLNNYIAFQRLRKDEKLEVEFEMGNYDKTLKIAPLLCTILIENAFKFVSNFTHRENKIVIKLYTRDGVLHCSFYNTTELQPPFVAKGSHGIGLMNLKRRLELLYSGKYNCSTRIENDFYETSLTLDLT